MQYLTAFKAFARQHLRHHDHVQPLCRYVNVCKYVLRIQ